jgi:DNA modification methylase
MKITTVPLSDLKPWPTNARSHDERNITAIRASLREFGQVEPLVVQKSSMAIIGGNGRLESMKLEGWTEAQVFLVEIDDVRAEALSLALNRTGELASWNPEMLKQDLDGLIADDFDVSILEFSADDLAAILGAQDPAGGQADPDAVPAPPDAATTRSGDRWIAGDHVLLCGDSGSIEDLDRLLDGAPIHLVNTDPPYNVNVSPRTANAQAVGAGGLPNDARNVAKVLGHNKGLTDAQRFDASRHGRQKPTDKKLRPRDRVLANDCVTDEQFDVMLAAWFGNIARVLLPGRCFYIWGGFANWANYCQFMGEAGLYFAQGITWIKHWPVLGRKDFMNDCEYAWYGWREGAGHKFYGPNNATNVWDVKKVNPQSMIHLTEKPVELAVRAMQYSSLPGENVLDLFGGSGSTLIGAHQTGRRAFLMEIDDLYCDVIVTRWQQFTGRQATLDGDGRTFDEIAAERLSGSSPPEPPVDGQQEEDGVLASE